MATYRVQIELPYYTLLPRDVAVNTFHVTCLPGLSAPEMDDVLDAFISFYNDDHSGGGSRVAQYLSAVLSRGSFAATATMYDLDDAEPRPPVAVKPFTLAAAAGTASIPTEAAICLSFRGSYPPGVNRGRRRGRAFLGPLGSLALTAGSSTTMPVPSATALTHVAGSAGWLLGQIPTINAAAFWSIWSRVDSLPVEIISGWVDNAFDTQRRRGNAPTGRQLWP